MLNQYDYVAREAGPQQVYNNFRKEGLEDMTKYGGVHCLENLLDRFRRTDAVDFLPAKIKLMQVKGIFGRSRSAYFSHHLKPVKEWNRDDGFFHAWVNHYLNDHDTYGRPGRVKVLKLHGLYYIQSGIKIASAAICSREDVLEAQVKTIRLIPFLNGIDTDEAYNEFASGTGLYMFQFSDKRNYRAIADSLDVSNVGTARRTRVKIEALKRDWVSSYLDFLHKFSSVPVEQAGDSFMEWRNRPAPSESAWKGRGRRIWQIMTGS